MKNPTALPQRQYGYSVVELMVASVVGLIVLSGAVTVFTGNSSSQELSGGMARIQESGRVALDILANDLRLAGYQGCTDGSIEPKVLAEVKPDISLPNGALWGAEYSNNTWTPTRLPHLENIDTQPAPGTDIIYVQHGSGRTTILASSMADANSPISIATNPDHLDEGDLIMISDCSSADIFRATSVGDPAADGSVAVGFAAGAHNEKSTLNNTYEVTGDRTTDPMRVMRFEANAYFVADTGRNDSNGNDIYSMYVLDTTASPIGNAIELVEGVENMQILYGVRSLTGAVRYLPARNMTVTLMEDVVSVQIGLLLASAEAVSDRDDDRTYKIADVNVAPPSDANATVKHSGGRKMRAAFNTTIRLRNRNFN